MSQSEPLEGNVTDEMTTAVLDALSRARMLFGGNGAPADPPVFAAPRGLEDGLGRGTFSPRVAQA